MGGHIITLDTRRRASLGKVGRPQDTTYEVTEHDDGRIELTPVVFVPTGKAVPE